jgi:hypothetical protein
MFSLFLILLQLKLLQNECKTDVKVRRCEGALIPCLEMAVHPSVAPQRPHADRYVFIMLQVLLKPWAIPESCGSV